MYDFTDEADDRKMSPNYKVTKRAELARRIADAKEKKLAAKRASDPKWRKGRRRTRYVFPSVSVQLCERQRLGKLSTSGG